MLLPLPLRRSQCTRRYSRRHSKRSARWYRRGSFRYAQFGYIPRPPYRIIVMWQTYSDVVRFTYIPATFNEALRMFPPVAHIPKVSAFDTTLRTKNKNGEIVVIPCPKGTQINLNALALHFNRKLEQQRNNNGTEYSFTAKYWHDPHTFNPDRFLGDWNRDAFLPFSAGARSCIGRRYVRILFYLKRESDNEYSCTG